MSSPRASLALPAGFLVGDYRLERVQGTWGFCVVYLAVHATSREAVAVHELVPEELVVRSEGGALIGRSKDAEEKLAWAAERFLREGRDLAEWAHPALQKVIAVFEANGTAYWVTPREDARNIKNWLQQLGRPPKESELLRLLAPLLAGLERLHGAGLFHLNLKPETILIDAQGPRLIHFSGARQAIARYAHQAGAVTTGYSPPEQYEVEKAEGPWTDIYSLAAVLHRAISGHAPPEADQRQVRDSFQTLAGRYSASYRLDFLSAVDAALAVEPSDRPQSIAGWRVMLGINPARGTVPRWPAFLGVAAAILLLGVGAWWWYPRPPRPDDSDKDQLAQNDVQKESSTEEKDKGNEEMTKAEAEEKAAEEQKKREEEQKEKERQLAEGKTDQDKMAAEKDAAAKAEAEKQAAEKAAQLAQEAAAAADAAAKAEAQKRAAEEAMRNVSSAAPAKKAESEKAAAQAAEEAEKLKVEAEKAATAAQDATKAAEKAAQARKIAEEELARLAVAMEEAKRKASEMAAQQARSEAEKRAAAEQGTASKKDPVETAAAGEKMAAQKALAETLAAEQAAAEKAAAERMASEKGGSQRSPAEKAAMERTAAEKIAAERAAGEKAAMERTAAEKAAAERAAAEKAAMERMAAEKAAAERAAAEKATMERMAAEKAAAERAAGEKAAMERMAAEKSAAERAAAEKAAMERMAAEKAAAEKAAAAKVEAEKMAANQKADPNQGKYKKTGVEGATEEEDKKTDATQKGGGLAVSGIPGIWETTATDADGKARRRLVIYDDGRYLISDNQNWKDTGVILANAGRIQMLSDATGVVVRSSFKLRSLSKIVTSGALGEEEWNRVSRSPGNDPNRPKK